MKRIAVVTDSNASVPEELVQELNIRVVPIVLMLDDHVFLDGVDITPGELYRWLRETRPLPSTSAPSVGDFLRVYAAAAEEASGIVSIHLSPKLSATHNAALAASQLVEGVPIRVINCHTAAMGQGFVVIEAARAAAAGLDLEGVVERAEEVSSKIHLLATIGTLTHLHRGGRIGGAVALLGAMLQVKPVLSLTDGHVEVFARPRTQSKAVQIMVEEMAVRVGGKPVHIAILHADMLEDAEVLRQQVEGQFDCVELYVTELTPVMGAHTGPGVLGVVFYVD